MATATIYPTSTSVDGGLNDDGARGTKSFATRRAEASCASTGVQPSTYTLIWQDEGGGGQCYMSRYALQFDTAFLSGSIINSATLDIAYDITGLGNDSSWSLGICGATLSSATTLATSDWSAYSALTGPTEFITRYTVASISDDAYKVASLNASGLAAINKSGLTKFMLRYSSDMDDSAITTGRQDHILVYGSGHASLKPRLVIDYTPPAGNPLFFSMGVTIG